MTIAIRHAWLQKHPSPAAASGEFHWYPPDGDRELRSGHVERSRGIDPPAILWDLAPGRISWAQLFAATAPTDGRRYVGLVLTIAEQDDAPCADLLDAIELPSCVPWLDDGAPPAASSSSLARHRDQLLEIARVPDGGLDGPRQDQPDPVAAIGRALLSGGAVIVDDPYRASLPQLVASIERLLPERVRTTPRSGVFRATGTGHAADRAGELIAAAWRDPASRTAQAWTLLCELASANERSVDDVLAQLASIDAPHAGLDDDERALAGTPRDFAMTLHAWGRGRLEKSAGASTLRDRFADVLVLRSIAALLAGVDPAPTIATARWHALLPADRRATLLDAVIRRGPSLRPYLDGRA